MIKPLEMHPNHDVKIKKNNRRQLLSTMNDDVGRSILVAASVVYVVLSIKANENNARHSVISCWSYKQSVLLACARAKRKTPRSRTKQCSKSSCVKWAPSRKYIRSFYASQYVAVGFEDFLRTFKGMFLPCFPLVSIQLCANTMVQRQERKMWTQICHACFLYQIREQMSSFVSFFMPVH